jgi:hypothetical protein
VSREERARAPTTDTNGRLQRPALPAPAAGYAGSSGRLHNCASGAGERGGRARRQPTPTTDANNLLLSRSRRSLARMKKKALLLLLPFCGRSGQSFGLSGSDPPTPPRRKTFAPGPQTRQAWVAARFARAA